MRCVLLLLFLVHPAIGQPLRGGAVAGERYRVIVSTDLGGSDGDDIQSMIHFLLYADLFDVEGLIASPPHAGRASDILDVIDVYARDYPRLWVSNAAYPHPDTLRALTKQGATDPAPAAGWSAPTEGSRWIVRRAHEDDPRPLYVLVWGAITDVAQALHDDPSIAARLRVYFIASWNEQQDPAAYAYVDAAFPELWFIRSNTTFRGWYMGGDQAGDLGNQTFVQQHVCGHGALGAYFCGIAPALPGEATGRIKMGDSPSVAYLLRGDPDDPESDHWGGRFVRRDGRPAWWIDDPDPAWAVEDRAGAGTVSRHREAYLRDWQRRMDRLAPPPSNR
ncbi:MAG: DUF1593 domain-containing protein [Rhodothermales bacterium]